MRGKTTFVSTTYFNMFNNFSRCICLLNILASYFRNLSELFLASVLAACFHFGEK